MHLELHCENCFYNSAESADTLLDDLGSRSFSSLEEGETMEDMIHAALASQPEHLCPECGGAMVVSEESLGQVAMLCLAEW